MRRSRRRRRRRRRRKMPERICVSQYAWERGAPVQTGYDRLTGTAQQNIVCCSIIVYPWANAKTRLKE